MSSVNFFFSNDNHSLIDLFFLVPPRLSPIPPIEVNLDPQHSQRASFHCRIERGSSDSLSLEWRYLNNTPIQSTNGITIDRSDYDTKKAIELRFDPVRQQHFGNYSCVAKNLADSTYSIASLLVQCKFEFSYLIHLLSSHSNSSTDLYWTRCQCHFEHSKLSYDHALSI